MSFKVDDKEFKAFLERAQRELSPQAQDTIVEKVSQNVRTYFVHKTPSKSGGVQNAWQVFGSKGERRVINTNPVMAFLEYGTPRKNPGAKIYPKKAKVLAIPIVNAGSQTSMSQTVRKKSKRKKGDASKFIFVKWVHGMKPKNIVSNYLPKIPSLLIREVSKVMTKL